MNNSTNMSYAVQPVLVTFRCCSVKDYFSNFYVQFPFSSFRFISVLSSFREAIAYCCCCFCCCFSCHNSIFYCQQYVSFILMHAVKFNLSAMAPYSIRSEFRVSFLFFSHFGPSSSTFAVTCELFLLLLILFDFGSR